MRDRRIPGLAAVLVVGGCIGEPDVEVASGAAGDPTIRVVRQDRVGELGAADLVAAGLADPASLATFFEDVPLAQGVDAALLRGPSVELREGGWIEVYSFWDGIDGTNDGVHREDDRAYRAATVVEEPHPAVLDRAPGADLRALPGTADFERLQLLQHLAMAAELYRQAGHDPGVVLVFLAPGGGVWRRGSYLRPQLEAVSDNAYFDEVAHFFWIAPPERTIATGAPITWRWAVIVHEMGHQVIDEIVDLDREAYRVDGLLSVRTSNVYSTLHEAVADLFAAAATGSPDLLGIDERDLSIAKPWEEELERSLDRTVEEIDWAGPPGAHERGAVIAHAVWRVGGAQDLARWTLDALRRLRMAADEAPVLGLGDVLEAFASTARAERRSSFCRALSDGRLVDFAGRPRSCEES